MCYAANVTNAMIDDINEKCNKVFQYYGYTYRNVFPANTSIGYSPGLPKMCIGITASDSPIKPNYLYVFFPDQEPMTLSGNNYTTWFYQIVNLNNGNREGPSGYSINKTIKWKYVYTEFNWASSTGYNFVAGEEYGATILTVPPFSFTTDLDPVTYNGLSGYALPFSYNETLSYLGTLESIPEGTNYIGVSFASVGSYGTVLRDIKNLYSNENSSTNLIIDNNNNIYVKNRYLNYNTQYSLFVDCYSDSTYEVVTGSLSTYIVAVAPGTQVTGGTITSLGSGEPYSTQNSTNDIISNITNYTPMSSGDLISGLVAYEPYSYSGDVNFFNDILQHVSQIFLDDNVHYIDIPIPMTTSVYRLYNNYWVTYNYLPELAIFISSAWWFLIFYIVIKKWSFVVDLIKVGDFRGSYQRNISIKEDFVDARCDNEFCFFNTKCNC